MSTNDESQELEETANNSELVNEIKRLNNSITTMRSMVNELITSHNELKDKITSLQTPHYAADYPGSSLHQLSNSAILSALQQRETDHTKTGLRKERQTEIVNGTKTCHANEYTRIFETLECPDEYKSTDEEIDAILSRRKANNEWPIRNRTYLAFSTNVELLKIRLHHSEKYNHVPVRITSTKGKDNRARCKLCMSYNKNAKGAGRNTSWMCSTCEVPLCVKCLIGEENDVRNTHHARWHTTRDLLTENAACCEEVVVSRKRKGDHVEGGEMFADEVDRVVGEAV